MGAVLIRLKYPLAALCFYPDVHRALSHLQVETDLRDIEDLPRFIARQLLSPTGRYHGVGMIVLDSIQGHGVPPLPHGEMPLNVPPKCQSDNF